MRITSLRVFVDLVESQSFSEAANRNGISQPAVSQQIGSLEEAFATSLVERSRRRFRLTPAGEALFDTAKEVLQSVDCLKDRIAKLEQNVQGRLLVVTSANLAIEFIPLLNQRLQTKYPDIALEVVYQPMSRLFADIAGNVADFGLIACPKEDARFEYVTLMEERLRFVAAAGTGLREKELKDNLRPFISYSPDATTAALIDKQLQDQGINVNPTLEFEHPETVKKALIATNGFSCLPEVQITQELASGQLVIMRGLMEPMVRRMCAVFSKQRQSNAALKVIQEFLREISAQKKEETEFLTAPRAAVTKQMKTPKRQRVGEPLGLG